MSLVLLIYSFPYVIYCISVPRSITRVENGKYETSARRCKCQAVNFMKHSKTIKVKFMLRNK